MSEINFKNLSPEVKEQFLSANPVEQLFLAKAKLIMHEAKSDMHLKKANTYKMILDQLTDKFNNLARSNTELEAIYPQGLSKKRKRDDIATISKIEQPKLKKTRMTLNIANDYRQGVKSLSETTCRGLTKICRVLGNGEFTYENCDKWSKTEKIDFILYEVKPDRDAIDLDDESDDENSEEIYEERSHSASFLEAIAKVDDEVTGIE